MLTLLKNASFAKILRDLAQTKAFIVHSLSQLIFGKTFLWTPFLAYLKPNVVIVGDI